MDELQDYELQLLSNMVHWATHQQMEQTRMLMYSVSAPYMKQKKKLHDFLPLSTDEEFEPAKPLEGEELKDARARIMQAFNIEK